MPLTLTILPRTLHFRQPVGTSRGVYTTRRIWLIEAADGEARGMGECAPLPDLSCDALPDYETVLRRFCDIVEQTAAIPYDLLKPYPSMLFGIETALGELKSQLPELRSTKSPLRGDTGGSLSPFSLGKRGIPINGLVWMGSYEEMLSRLEEKMRLGFRCIKLKIGAIDFDKELQLIRRIRERYTKEQIELRVDANGAFSPTDALKKLRLLSQYDIHSIEQPIRQGQWREMARLCRQSPLPIALDEELIGVNDTAEKRRLLDTIRPAYIILKPSLHGGMCGTQEWVSLARERGIGSWITSALESNVGLFAIARLTARIYGDNITMPQGLGTGALFTDNIPMPIEIRGDELWALADPVMLTTSGSTGAPKTFYAERSRMVASALATCRFLSLSEGDTALLCLPTKYIAGKMMELRAEVYKLRLTRVEPSGHPLKDVGADGFDFAAMIPLQVYNLLQVPEERRRLSLIRNLIIGGGAIDEALEAELRDFPNNIYSTYGMTETLSHIALRRVNGPEASLYYTPMEGVSVSVNADGCLVITAPRICPGPLVTNDLAELSPDGSRFRILGRRDNVVCSGGIKLHIEDIENTLRPFIPDPFMLTKVSDPRLGEALVLLTTGSTAPLPAICREHLEKRHCPRHYLTVASLPLTPTGKPARREAQLLAQSITG